MRLLIDDNIAAVGKMTEMMAVGGDSIDMVRDFQFRNSAFRSVN